jgi:hypothetical protein
MRARKRKMTADQIRAEIGQRLRDAGCRECLVGQPRAVKVRAFGRNWDVDVSAAGPHCRELAVRVVRRAGNEIDLKAVR